MIGDQQQPKQKGRERHTGPPKGRMRMVSSFKKQKRETGRVFGRREVSERMAAMDVGGRQKLKPQSRHLRVT